MYKKKKRKGGRCKVFKHHSALDIDIGTSSSKRKKPKKKLGFTQEEFEAICSSIPLENNIHIRKIY